jgi:hypothetical protein
MTRPFLCVTSGYGWIGLLTWINSDTTPHQDIYRCGKMIRRWGGVTLHYDPSMKFWEEVDA